MRFSLNVGRGLGFVYDEFRKSCEDGVEFFGDQEPVTQAMGTFFLLNWDFGEMIPWMTSFKTFVYNIFL